MERLVTRYPIDTHFSQLSTFGTEVNVPIVLYMNESIGPCTAPAEDALHTLDKEDEQQYLSGPQCYRICGEFFNGIGIHRTFAVLGWLSSVRGTDRKQR